MLLHRNNFGRLSSIISIILCLWTRNSKQQDDVKKRIMRNNSYEQASIEESKDNKSPLTDIIVYSFITKSHWI
jgi:hypothetical protein